MIATAQDLQRSSFHWRLDAGSGITSRRALRTGVLTALDRGVRTIVIDCGSWSQLDLIVLSALVSCASECRQQGAEFQLENLGGDIRHRIEALNLGDRVGLAA